MDCAEARKQPSAIAFCPREPALVLLFLPAGIIYQVFAAM
jgi:hypothetical protein